MVRRGLARRSKPGARRWSVIVVIAALVAAGVLPAHAATGQPAGAEGSRASAQMLAAEVVGTDLAEILELEAAVAENSGGEPVIATAALDLSVLEALDVSLGQVSLLGDNGFLVLGALNQYAEAREDGYSYAAAGAVSDAGVVEIPDDATPGSSGASFTISTEDLDLGDLLALRVEFAAIASTATLSAEEGPVGTYEVADLDISVGGSLIEDVAAQVDTVLATATSVLSTLGGLLGVEVEIENPLADGTVSISEEDLLEILGVETINELPAGTDLLSYLIDAVIAKITEIADELAVAVGEAVEEIQAASLFTTICAPPLLPPNPLCALLGTLVQTLQVGLATVVTTVTETVAPALVDAVAGLLSMPVGTETIGDDGSFTKTALSAVVGPEGSIAHLDLASSTVGPNGGTE